MPDNSSENDIAIVGLALRVPGARNVKQFWNNLRNGIESIGSRTTEELLAAGEPRERLRQKNYVPRAADLERFAAFDAEFFGFSPKDAAIMDPQHRQFLECAWEALEDAARPPESVSGPVGVFASCGMGSYFYFNICSNKNLVDQDGMFLLRHTGNDKDFLATRTSYIFDFRGPSVSVQTACSSSLVAVHYAAQSLHNGECDMALAGGVTIEQPQGRGYLYQEGEILSPDGHCRAFDHRAAGTVFGSGVGVVVLRRLADAIADGDPIHAIIKSSAVNNDGASKASYLAPSVDGQSAAVVEAQALAGISADSIQYVECHGTGTKLGDPIEIAALTQAFRLTTNKIGYCRVGSVKSNIGHLDTAAGVVSLIKAVLSVENKVIVPTIGYEAPNPEIDFPSSPFIVADRLINWPEALGPRRAAINSLGVGGTNAHVIIEAAPVSAVRMSQADDEQEPKLLVVSARNRKALDENCERLAAHIPADNSARLVDSAHTLLTGRRHFDHRRVIAAYSRADAVRSLAGEGMTSSAVHTAVEGAKGVLLFPGGGAQYPGMGKALYACDPIFAQVVDEGLSYLPKELSIRIHALLFDTSISPVEASAELLRPSLQLPAILIIEIALAKLWQSWKLKPDALIGHSMGEYAAACIARVMTFERAVKLVKLRGELFDEITGGGMLSVPLSAEDIFARLPDDLDLGVVNAPQLCVVSGPEDALGRFRERLLIDGVEATRIPINIAAHSRMLTPVLGRFEQFLRETPLAAPEIPIVSNLTGTWMTAEQATDPGYWVKHLRSTVRFSDGVATLASKSRVFIECGPGRILSSLLKAQGYIDTNVVIHSLPHADEGINDRLHFTAAIGRAWATGIKLPIGRLSENSDPRRLHLPSYAFQHQDYFIPPALASRVEAGLPEKCTDMAKWGWTPTWTLSCPATLVDGEQRPASYLIFCDDAGIGDELAKRLSSSGQRVVTVAFGDAFAVLSGDKYVVCPEFGREGYDALFDQLNANGFVPDRLLHLWLLTPEQKFRPGSNFFHRNQERGFNSMFHLAQAMEKVELRDTLQVTIVTNGMLRVDRDERVQYPDKATVLGPAQVIPREFSKINVRVIDVILEQTARASSVLDCIRSLRGERSLQRDVIDSVVRSIWDDLFAEPANEVVAVRNGRRWSRTYRRLELLEVAKDHERFRHRGVYMVTGGSGDLGIACAKDLASKYGARIALVGRLELPKQAKWDDYVAARGENTRAGRVIAAIRAIEKAGGEAEYFCADITDPAAVGHAVAAIKSRFGALNGVLHAAGVLRDELISLKSVVDIEEVMAPKVLGTLVLNDVLKEEQLDLVILFSSTSTDTAPVGQVDYVAANAFLNAFADSGVFNAKHVVAVHWGFWSDIGLAARAIRTAEGEVGQAVIEHVTKPLLDDRVRDDGADWLEVSASPDRFWILDEHRLLTGEAIWPGTAYLELISEAADFYGFRGGIEIKNLVFRRPLHVDDGSVRTVRAMAKREAGALRVEIESFVNTDNGPGWLRHADATVEKAANQTRQTVDVGAEIGRCSRSVTKAGGQHVSFPQGVNLKTGERWNSLHEMHFGENFAVARIALDERRFGDADAGYYIHPALADLATGYAMDLIPGYSPEAGLWVPAGYRSFRLLRPLPSTIWSIARLSESEDYGLGFATFDFTITDHLGEVVAIVNGFSIRHIEKSLDLSALLTDVSGATVLKAVRQPKRNVSPAIARLSALSDQGIAPAEGGEALRRAVATGQSQIIVSSVDLLSLQEVAARPVEVEVPVSALTRIEGGEDFIAPNNDIERMLAQFWSALLGIEKIGTNDNFFDLGGHSLVAVRLFRMIKDKFAVDFPISVLFEAPTISQCAKLIEQFGAKPSAPEFGIEDKPVARSERRTFMHLVPMDTRRGAEGTPLFICAGMFGNVLNLRHLALHLGPDRPVYGLQARGLYGDQRPHETFEDMASSCLAEIRAVQPHGPYLLCGFSGGGLVAYEVAQKLRQQDETVGLVVMLDTPYPQEVRSSFADRMSIRLQEFRREGAAFFLRWARERSMWELRNRREARDSNNLTGDQFHNFRIAAAFIRAVNRYKAQPCDYPVLLLRPRPKVAYVMRDGRRLDLDRRIIKSDNGWSPFVSDLTVREVAGDHDSMVLEPNVRILTKYYA